MTGRGCPRGGPFLRRQSAAGGRIFQLAVTQIFLKALTIPEKNSMYLASRNEVLLIERSKKWKNI